MSSPDAVPDRIRWAVDLLDPSPSDHVLEIGCGPGVAAVLLAERLTDGRVTAIDRSATAVERTTARGRSHIDAGRLDVRRATVADLELPDRSIDRALAVNVNLFWTTPALAELTVLRAVLGESGSVLLAYEAPGDRAGEMADRVGRALVAQSFTATVHQGPEPSLVAIVATPD